MSRGLIALVALALAAAPAAAQDPLDPPGTRYYFLLFGGQSVPFKPRTAHTWATWVKATPTGAGPVMLESQTISWLPPDGRVHPWKFRSSVGHNHTLEGTLAIMAGVNSQVSLWGPFEVDANRYCLALQQAATLESGAVRFRSFDSLGRNRAVQHCVHAVTFADPAVSRYRQPVIRVGEPGTSNLAEKYLRNGAFVGGAATHDWLVAALGLDRHPLIRRVPGEHIPREWR
jgi:hypothetical protein